MASAPKSRTNNLEIQYTKNLIVGGGGEAAVLMVNWLNKTQFIQFYWMISVDLQRTSENTA